MSMMQQPSPPKPPSIPPDKSWLRNEWDHLAEMPPLTAWLLLLPTLLVGLINPLLPLMAYGMQRWARSSWTWRDRWASVWTWAKQGVLLVAILLLIAWLAQVHVLFFPALVAVLQNAWHTAHLPNDLSLSLTPMNRYALVTRILLFLPLAPALSLYYERIDSRTPMHLQRILTAADLATPRPSPPVAPPASTPTPAHDAASTPDQAATQTTTTQPARPKTASTKQQHKDTTTKTVEQMTIDSVLAPQQQGASSSTPAPTTPSTPPQETGTKKGTRRTTTGQRVTQDAPATQETPPTHPGLIHVPDWDDVAE